MVITPIVNALLVFILTVPLSPRQVTATPDARWVVKVAGRDRRPNKSINCHALEYFSDSIHLKAFDYAYNFPKPYPEGITDEVQVQRRGEIQGFAIYDVVHTIDSRDAPVDWEKFSYPPALVKMILVERKPGEFCEIFHEQDSDGEFVAFPSYFVDVETEKVLAAHDRITGNGNYFYEAYWTFDKDGPVPLDLGIIKQAVDKLLPLNMHVYRGMGFEIETLEYDMVTIQEWDGKCCYERGRVHLTFALKNRKLIIVSQKFSSEP